MRKNSESDKKPVDLTNIFKGLLICFVLSVVLIFAASCVATLTTMHQEAVNLTVGIITYFCVGLCGYITAGKSGSNGLLCGALLGFLYVTILFAAGSLILSRASFSVGVALTFVICTICGALGGIIGVNSKSKRRR